MAQIKIVQNRFTSGEIGDYLDAREDLEIYQTGANTIENFFVLPQGGLLKRSGFEYIDGVDDSSESTKGFAAHSRLIPFRFSTEQEYVLVFVTGKFHVYKDGAFAVTVTDSDLNNFTTTQTFTLNAAKSLADGETLTQLNSGATAVVVGATSSSTSVVVVNVTGVWTTNSGDTITGSTTGALSTYASGLGTAPNIDEWRFAQTFDTLIMVHEDYAPIQITRTGHTSWTVTPITHTFLPMANFDNGLTLNPAAKTGTGIVITASATAVNDFAVGEYIRLHGGLCKITNISTTSITVDIEEDLSGTTLVGSTEYLQTAISSTKGYPRSVSFHQNRLIYGGTKTKPQTVFGSQSGDFFNFKPTVSTTADTTTTGSITDDSGFAFTIGSDSVNVIEHLVSKQTLFIFTTSGEYELQGTPVTPTNVNIRLQTKYGVSEGAIRPTTVDNEVMFVSANGRELRGFVFDFNSDSFYAKNYTIIAHDILNNPKDIAFLRAHRNTNQNYVFLVNEDGELAVFGINVEKQVMGWSRFTTPNGKFKKIVTVNDSDTNPETQRLYALVERTRKLDSGASVICYHLERLSEETVYLDGWQNKVNATPFSTIGSAHPLANQTANIVADGVVHANETVTSFASGGNITLDDNFSNVHIGASFTSTLETVTLPVTVNGQPYRGEQITKVSALINLNKTQDLNIDGSAVDFRFAGQSLDSAINPFTGTKKISVSGISTDPIVTLTSTVPLQCTILGLTTEVKYGT